MMRMRSPNSSGMAGPRVHLHGLCVPFFSDVVNNRVTAVFSIIWWRRPDPTLRPAELPCSPLPSLAVSREFTMFPTFRDSSYGPVDGEMTPGHFAELLNEKM